MKLIILTEIDFMRIHQRELILRKNRIIALNMAESDDLHTIDVEETFNRGAKYLQTVTSDLDANQLLKFYSFYKQATVGPCNIPRPNWYQIQAKQKWEAWQSLGDMNSRVAMEHYIHALTEINPSWEETSKTESKSWVAVSRLTSTETELHDVDKTFLDWVKDNNEKKVQEVLIQDPMFINVPDEDGLLPIHWAADRGYVTMIECLIRHGANVNSQDRDGQTPLHYAASCGHFEAVKCLLSAGAQSCIADNDGLKPKDVAVDQLEAIL